MECYMIFHDGNEWIARTTEFGGLSGCDSTPILALSTLMDAVKMAREAKDAKEAT